jgi:hypothetical protein
MGLRFRRRLRLDRRLRNLPGLWVNVSKTGGSVSVGRRGATLNVSKRGKMTTLGLPGSGLSHRSKRDPGRDTRDNFSQATAAADRASRTLDRPRHRGPRHHRGGNSAYGAIIDAFPISDSSVPIWSPRYKALTQGD